MRITMRTIGKCSCIAAAAIAAIAVQASAAVVTDKGNGIGGATGTGNGGNDAYWQFNPAETVVSTGDPLLIKKGIASETTPKAGTVGNSEDDRIAMLKFDTTGLGNPGAIQVAALKLTVQDNGAHKIPAGYTLQLWGIPDAAVSATSQELSDPATLNAATSLYTTGTNGTPGAAADATLNRVEDSLLTLLGSVTVSAANPAGGTVLSITSPDLATFLQNNTNGVASFLLVGSVATGAATPTVLSNRVASGSGLPVLATNSDVPEPTGLGVVSTGMMWTGLRRRRAH